VKYPLVVALALAALYAAVVRHGPALTDEYVYLASARYFADTGSLDSRFYNYSAILSQGYPHQDMHAPGYTILLGAWSRVFPFGYWAAVALNLAAYLGLVVMVPHLARRLGAPDDIAVAVATAALPAYLPYVFWVMPEVLLGPFIVGGLLLNASARRGAAVGAGIVWCLALLVRESAVFALPAALVLAWRSKRLTIFLATLAVAFGLVYVPLSKNRGEGGTNFWRQTSENSAVEFGALRAVTHGDVSSLWGRLEGRVQTNVKVFSEQFSPTEKGMLALLFALPIVAALGWRRLDRGAREYLLALAAGAFALDFAMLAMFVVPPWSGIRYAMALGPAFLAVVRNRAALVAVVVLSLGLDGSALAIFNAYKLSRQKRQEGITEYVDRYVPPGATRIVLERGYHYGWHHYPLEVVADGPEDEESLRAFAHAIWYDYLVIPGDNEMQKRLDKRERYERLNPEDPEPPLLIYKRLR
jgi:hypothetical protein